MQIVWGVYWALVGAVAGSAAITFRGRAERRMSLTSRSHCFDCRRKIAWYDLVPVASYLVLSGRCRHCGAPIGHSVIDWEVTGGYLAMSFFVVWSQL